MTEYVTTHVTRVNINNICLLIKDMHDSAQELSVNTDNTTEYQCQGNTYPGCFHH